MTLAVIMGSFGCTMLIIITTYALAEVISSDSLPTTRRWQWTLALILFSGLASVAWYTSRSRKLHAPVNLVGDAGPAVSPRDIETLIREIDEHRTAGGA